MKGKRFSEETIVRILKEAECKTTTVQEICRKHGISEQSYYRWRKTYGGMMVSEMKRLKKLEKENVRLKRLLAERDLELDVAR